MKKKLFEHYVELNCYHLAARHLHKNKVISRTELRVMESKIFQAETSLIVPKQSKTTHPRTLTRVK